MEDRELSPLPVPTDKQRLHANEVAGCVRALNAALAKALCFQKSLVIDVAVRAPETHDCMHKIPQVYAVVSLPTVVLK